jgi:hypothetical protein
LIYCFVFFNDDIHELQTGRQPTAGSHVGDASEDEIADIVVVFA